YAAGRTYDNSYRHDQVATELDKTSYHPVWRCMAWLRAARMHRNNAQLAGNDLDAAMKLLPEIARDKGVPTAIWLVIGDEMSATVEGRPVNGQMPGQWVYNELNRVLPDSSVALTFKGKYHITWAWEARGGGWANTVTQDGWKLMRERLAVAQEALEKAWAL